MSSIFIIVYNLGPQPKRIQRLYYAATAQDASNITGQLPADQPWRGPFAPPRSRYLSLYWQASADDVPVQAQVPSDLSWSPSFHAPWSKLLVQWRQNEPQDASNITNQPEFNPSVLGVFHPPKHTLLVQLRQNEAQDLSQTMVQPETNTNVVLRTFIPKYRLLQSLVQNAATDIPSGPAPSPPAPPRWRRLWLGITHPTGM